MSDNEFNTILIVDDENEILNSLNDLFIDNYNVLTASSGSEAIEVCSKTHTIAAIIMDIKMASMDGIVTAQNIKKEYPDINIIFHTGFAGEYDESALDRIEKPFEYVQKGKNIPKLVRSVRNAVELFNLQKDNNMLIKNAEINFGMIGRSDLMQKVFKDIIKVSRSGQKVMILGETGTGKELVARAVHSLSNRCDNVLAILNCNHKNSDLIEAELFGNTKGAFTGADQERLGIFEYADQGTVFLDEIGDLDITSQAKILRVVEYGEFQKLGDPKTIKTDVRLICATHMDLEKLVEEGKFRQDLYYRLKGLSIILPPLRERKIDIEFLVKRFVNRFTIDRGESPRIFDSSAMKELINYDWLGNVRQLSDAVETLITLTESGLITSDDVSEYLNNSTSTYSSSNRMLSARLLETEKTIIIKTLVDTKYNVAAAARILGIDNSTLHKKLKKFKIHIESIRI